MTLYEGSSASQAEQKLEEVNESISQFSDMALQSGPFNMNEIEVCELLFEIQGAEQELSNEIVNVKRYLHFLYVYSVC